MVRLDTSEGVFSLLQHTLCPRTEAVIFKHFASGLANQENVARYAANFRRAAASFVTFRAY